MNDYSSATYAELAVGNKASFRITVTDKMIDEFGHFSGNLNPLHMDLEYGRRSTFHERIAHGMVVGALFSRLLGMQLPGEHSLCLSQNLRFHHPVFAGDELTISGEITGKTDAFKTITVHTVAENAGTKKIVVSGDAIVQVLK